MFTIFKRDFWTQLDFEKVAIGFLAVSFFVGIWYGLPLKDTINDELYFVGGVLRAMEHHAIFPLGIDVPYGTLTYLLNYLLIGVVLLVLLPFFGFNLAALKIFVLNHTGEMYLVPRFVSAVVGVCCLWLVYKILKQEIKEKKSRIFLMIILFTNIITTLIFHTGKMWTLSTLLVLVSFYCLYQILTRVSSGDNSAQGRYLFASIIFSWLALTNFPLNAIFLINLPILLFVFRKDKQILTRIFYYSLFGFFIFATVIWLNWEGIKSQLLDIFVTYHPIIKSIPARKIIENISVFKSFLLYPIRLLLLYPLLLPVVILAAFRGIKNKKLFYISLIYSICYFIGISAISTWVLDFNKRLHYLFYLGFFLVFLIASLNFRFTRFYYILSIVSLVYFFPSLYFLSAPTTYNRAYQWLSHNFNSADTVIVNNVDRFQFPKNKESYLLEEYGERSIRRQNFIEYNLNSWQKFLVIDQFSRVDANREKKNVYYIFTTPPNDADNWQLIKTFKNDIDDNAYFAPDYNVGNYFNFSYFKITNWGENVYIYKK